MLVTGKATSVCTKWSQFIEEAMELLKERSKNPLISGVP